MGPPAVDPLDALHALDAAVAAGDHAVDGVGRAREVHGSRGVGWPVVPGQRDEINVQVGAVWLYHSCQVV